MRGLIEALNNPKGRTEAAELIRSLVEKIVFIPEEGKPHVEIVGDLAGILNLAANEKSGQKPATGTVEIEQLEVVAGARSHLYLLFRTDHKLDRSRLRTH